MIIKLKHAVLNTDVFIRKDYVKWFYFSLENKATHLVNELGQVTPVTQTPDEVLKALEGGE